MKGIKEKIRRRWQLRWLLLVSNWVFQGILHADRTEKIYKLVFTFFFSAVFFLILQSLKVLATHINIVLAIFLSHTLNWLVNGSLSTILLHRLYIGGLDKNSAFNYLFDLSRRLELIDSIKICLVFGSISRGELTKSSDIDICFVRKPGFLNAMKAIKFIVTEKFRTNINYIPIEPYLADSIDYMKGRYRSDEDPVVIKNSSRELDENFDDTLAIEEEQKMS